MVTKHFDVDTPLGRNATSASQALLLVQLYAAMNGETIDGPGDLLVAMGDLMGDLAHLIDMAGLDWGEVEGRGYQNYCQERVDALNASGLDGWRGDPLEQIEQAVRVPIAELRAAAAEMTEHLKVLL